MTSLIPRAKHRASLVWAKKLRQKETVSVERSCTLCHVSMSTSWPHQRSTQNGNETGWVSSMYSVTQDFQFLGPSASLGSLLKSDSWALSQEMLMHNFGLGPGICILTKTPSLWLGYKWFTNRIWGTPVGCLYSFHSPRLACNNPVAPLAAQFFSSIFHKSGHRAVFIGIPPVKSHRSLDLEELRA